MIPFCYVVYELVVGLSDATSKLASASVSSLISAARCLTVISWLTYPFVYIAKMLGLSGPTATMYDGIMIWAIASEKSKLDEQGSLL